MMPPLYQQVRHKVRRQPVDTKQGLARYWTQRIILEAIVTRFGRTEDDRRVMLVQQVTCNGEWLADHTWIPCTAFEQLHLWHGAVIQFEARVIRYVKKNHPTLFHYGLADIAAPCLLHGENGGGNAT